MMDLTFLIPTRIETEDRLRNIISSVSYLLRHVPAKVLVKEVAPHSTFKHRALPEIKKYVDTSNLTYVYEESGEDLFCKSKVFFMQETILSIDQGTSSTRAVLFNSSGKILHMEQELINTIFPVNGWVEQDADELWSRTLNVTKKIISYSKNTNIMEEGCLSIPEQFAEIERSEEIIVEYINEKKKILKKRVKGIESRILQHEIDHLSGKLFIDYLSSLKRNIIIRKVKKLLKVRANQ